MKGVVKGISLNKQRIAVHTDYGYTVFDIQDGEVSHGHIVSGNLDDHGDQELINITTDEELSVYIEAIQATQSFADALLKKV